MAKKKLPPEWLIVPNAHRHVHRVAIVRSKDAYGRPLLVEIQHNQDQKIDISKPENREMITCYVPEVITTTNE